MNNSSTKTVPTAPSDLRYLQNHGIATEMENALSQLMVDMPEDPLQSLLEYFEKVVERRKKERRKAERPLNIVTVHLPEKK